MGERGAAGQLEAALMELLATAPATRLPEGLHYPSQLRRIAEKAGLALEPQWSLDDVLARARAQIRARYGEPSGAAEVGGTGEAEALTPTVALVPPPGLDDLGTSRELRDRLASVLWNPDSGERRLLLGKLAADFALVPGLDDTDRWTVRSRCNDFCSQFAAAMVHSSLRLISEGFLPRLKRCADPECGQPFVDRTRPGNRGFCSPRCSARLRTGRRRDRDHPIG